MLILYANSIYGHFCFLDVYCNYYILWFCLKNDFILSLGLPYHSYSATWLRFKLQTIAWTLELIWLSRKGVGFSYYKKLKYCRKIVLTYQTKIMHLFCLSLKSLRQFSLALDNAAGHFQWWEFSVVLIDYTCKQVRTIKLNVQRKCCFFSPSFFSI